MKFETREKIGNILMPVASIGIGGLMGMATVAVTDTYANACGFGNAAKVTLACVGAIGSAVLTVPIISRIGNQIIDWVYAPRFEELLSDLKANEPETQLTQKTEAE